MSLAAGSFYKSRFSTACPVIAVSLAIHAAAISWFDFKPDLSLLSHVNLGSVSAPVSVAVNFAAFQEIQARKIVREKIAEPAVEAKKPVIPVRREIAASRKPDKVSRKATPEKKQSRHEKDEKQLRSADKKPAESMATSQASTVLPSEVAGVSNSNKVITQPVFRTSPPPLPYPRLSVRRNQQGRVMVEVTINSSGNPVDAKVLHSSGYSSLDKAALSWVARLEFVPVELASGDVTAKLHIPVLFELQRGRRG